MPWTDEQKTHARAELLRRRTHQTAASCRKDFFVPLGLCVAFLAMFVFTLSRPGSPNLSFRGTAILLSCLATGAISFTGALAYVRFLDWRRFVARSACEKGA